jgi:hypothetical protein
MRNLIVLQCYIWLFIWNEAPFYRNIMINIYKNKDNSVRLRCKLCGLVELLMHKKYNRLIFLLDYYCYFVIHFPLLLLACLIVFTEQLGLGIMWFSEMKISFAISFCRQSWNGHQTSTSWLLFNAGYFDYEILSKLFWYFSVVCFPLMMK